MERRAVTQVRRTTAGVITALVDLGKAWSPRSADGAMRDMAEDGVVYYVPWPEGETVVRVAEAASGTPILWCDRDDRTPGRRNGLLDLPQAPDG